LTGAFFDHAVVILMENQGIYNICGPNPGGTPHCNGSNTPYLDSLANNYTLGLNYTSLINTSAPNYIGLIGGSTFGCTAGGCGSLGAITHSNVVDRLETDGLSWKAYFENYTVSSGCSPSSSPPYNRIHNPFIWFKDIYFNQTRCANLVKANPSSCTITDCALINDLNGPSPPSFAWLTPNDCDDMHGDLSCTRNKCLSPSLNNVTICEQDGDAYLKTLVPNILNSTIFKTQRSALFITFDEGTGFCLPNHKPNGDCVYAVWSGPVAKKNGSPSYNRYNHYSFLKTLEFNWNLQSLQTNDTSASAMKEFFSPTFPLSPSPTSLTVSAGSNVTSTVTLSSLNGFNGTVNLTAFANPSGPSLTVNPIDVILKNQQTNSSALSFSASFTGNYTVTVTGTSGALSRSAVLTVRVVDFRVSATVTSVASPVGSNASSTITVTSLNGYSGIINLTATVRNASIPFRTGGSGGGRIPLEMLPPAISTMSDSSLPSASVSPASLVLPNGGTRQSSLRIIVSLSVQAGDYPITVNASDGVLSHRTQLTMTVSDFSLSSATSSVTIQAGSNSTQTLSLGSLNGFVGNLTMSAGFNPSGPLATFNPSMLHLNTSGNNSVLTIAVPSNTTAGNYTLTVQARSGSLTHTIYITVSVPPALTTILSKILGSNPITLLALLGLVGLICLVSIQTTDIKRTRRETVPTRKIYKTRAFHNRRNPVSRPNWTVMWPLWTTSRRSTDRP
jgi:hypothetical protein